jgi:diacylglycerol kinase (ATP)
LGKPGNTGIRRIIRAAGFSSQGLAYAWQQEAAFRQEVSLIAVLIPAAFWLGRSPTEIAFLIASCLLVMIVELINSAIEAVVDRIGSEQHTLAGAAKDLGSAAVLISLVLLAVVWIAVIYDRFLA